MRTAASCSSTTLLNVFHNALTKAGAINNPLDATLIGLIKENLIDTIPKGTSLGHCGWGHPSAAVGDQGQP